MRKLLGILVLALMLAGCNWSQGWHWPRTAANGSSATETLVYFENHVVGYQGPYVAWAAQRWSLSPAVRIVMTGTCPAGRNCVKWYTRELPSPWAGLTGISVGGSRHIISAWVKLDPDVGKINSIAANRYVSVHEACHALGGGWDNIATPEDEHFCGDKGAFGGVPTAHDYEELARVYNHGD